jgi:hypothetical protein
MKSHQIINSTSKRTLQRTIVVARPRDHRTPLTLITPRPSLSTDPRTLASPSMSSSQHDDGTEAPPPAEAAGGWNISHVLRLSILYMVITTVMKGFSQNQQNGDIGAAPSSTGYDAGSSVDLLYPIPKKDKAKNMLENYLPDEVLNPYKNIPTFSAQGPPHLPVFLPGTALTIELFVTEGEFHDNQKQQALLGAPEVEGEHKQQREKENQQEPTTTSTTTTNSDALFRWRIDDFQWASSKSPQQQLTQSTQIPVSTSLANNATTVWCHLYVSQQGFSSDASNPYYDSSKSYYKKVQVNKHRLRKKNKDVRNLLGEDVLPDDDESDDGDRAQQQRRLDRDDESVLGLAAKDKTEDQVLSYWKPSMTIQFVSMSQSFARGCIPPQMATHMDFSDSRGSYFPIVYFNEFWITSDKLIPINGTVDSLPLNITIEETTPWKWQMMAGLEQQWKSQAAMSSGGDDRDSDMLRNMLQDTNPILLGITMAVSILHSVFDILAFKNEIAFFKGKKSMEGISIRTMVVNCFFQVVIFLYLADNDTSFMILVSNGVGLLIELWKISKAVKISVDGGTLKWEEADSYKKSKTKEYDEIATSHLLYATMPLMTGYAAFSLMQMKHKSWYSWVLNSMVGFIYMFGCKCLP